MKKIVGIFAGLMLVMGIAFAGAPQGLPNYEVGNDSASVDQTITVTIPERVALHVDTTEWNLDLNDIEDEACFAVSKKSVTEAGQNSAAPKQLFNNFATLVAENMGDITTWDEGKPALISVVNTFGPAQGIYKATTYPAVNIQTPDDNQISGDEDKGYLVCFFGKVIQKYANTPWEFSASIYASDAADKSGFGHFGLADIRAGSATAFSTPTADGTSHELDGDSSTTGGWLDDYILEGFYFDGTEVADTYELTVTYTLTGVQ